MGRQGRARLEKDFEQISEMIKKEVDRFERTRVKDFKETLVKYLEALMLHQQQVLYELSSLKLVLIYFFLYLSF